MIAGASSEGNGSCAPDTRPAAVGSGSARIRAADGNLDAPLESQRATRREDFIAEARRARRAAEKSGALTPRPSTSGFPPRLLRVLCASAMNPDLLTWVEVAMRCPRSGGRDFVRGVPGVLYRWRRTAAPRGSTTDCSDFTDSVSTSGPSDLCNLRNLWLLLPASARLASSARASSVRGQDAALSRPALPPPRVPSGIWSRERVESHKKSSGILPAVVRSCPLRAGPLLPHVRSSGILASGRPRNTLSELVQKSKTGGVAPKTAERGGG